MNLYDIEFDGLLGRKKKDTGENPEAEKTEKKDKKSRLREQLEDVIREKRRSFCLGISGVFRAETESEMTILGYIRGKVRIGDKCYLTDPGKRFFEPIRMKVTGIWVNGIEEEEAANHQIEISMKCIDSEAEYDPDIDLRVGAVVYLGEVTPQEIFTEYLNSIGAEYVVRRDLNLSQEEQERFSLSDAREIWYYFHCFYKDDVRSDKLDVLKLQYRRKHVRRLTMHKLFAMDYVYCIFGKNTGEPYMFQESFDEGSDKYGNLLRDIILFPETHMYRAKRRYKSPNYNFVKIQNGPEGDGIYKFVCETIRNKGIRKIRIFDELTAFTAEEIRKYRKPVKKE
ncbi:MAG: hypothetical protein LIV11_10455 [Bacillota bacterium]|nr:hypothetical protein [Bacillota bacterium]